MNWAIGQGYAGLNSSVNKRESARQDLATLGVLDKELKSQREEQEQAQLKEQAYYEQISKFADTLLAPDRARINNKAKDMSAMLRNHVKQFGGDMTKFFENGGHKLMNEYKSGIVNSEEASQYLDNKKNMERILDMQQKGFGHLINPTDLYNLQNYQKEGNGKITYTGMLNEVKIPDPNTEIFGKEMSPEKILHHEGNYTKFYANYKMTYPEAGEPSEKDLLMFVSSQHSDILGTNWQKPMAERKQAFDEFTDKRNFEHDVYKDNRNFEYGEYRDNVGDYQWQKGQDLAERKQSFEEELSLIEMYKDKGGAQKSSSSPTGYVDYAGNPMTKEDAEATNSFMYDVDMVNSFLNGKVNTIAQATSEAAGIFNAQFGEILDDNTMGFRDDSSLGTGGFWKVNGIRELNNDYHRLSGSKMLLTGQIAQGALEKTPLFKFDQNGDIKNLDLSKNPDLFSANGVQVKKWSAGDTKIGGENILSGENFATEINKSTFKVQGAMTAFIVKDKNGNDMLLTEVGKNGDGGKWDKKDKANAKWAERYDQKSKPRSVMVVAIQNENGQTFYKPVDGNVEKSIMSSFSGFNLGKIKDGKKVAAKNATIAINKQNEPALVYRDLKRDTKSMSKIRQQVQVATGNPNSSKFDAAAISYYTHLKNMHRNETGQEYSNEQLVNSADFYKMVEAATDTPELKSRLNQIMNNPRSTSYDLVNFIIQNTEYDGGKSWLNNLQYIETIKYQK